MAIGPEQLKDSFKKDISEFEKIIDRLLVTQGDLSAKDYVCMSIPRGMSYAHFEVLRQKYLSAGWKDVKWNSDQREGDWLEFKSKI